MAFSILATLKKMVKSLRMLQMMVPVTEMVLACLMDVL